MYVKHSNQQPNFRVVAMFKHLLILFGAIFYFSFATCPNGFIQFYTDPTLCFSFQINKTNFINAEGICINLGGHLASVHSMFENMFVQEKGTANFTDSASSDFWFGLNAVENFGIWTWTDGTSFDFNDWDKGQPKNTSDTNCGVVNLESGKWNADNCNKEKPFVCLVNKYDPPSTTTIKPTKCLDTWTYYPTTGYCYKVFDNATFLDAEDRCKISGAHLASIHNQDENLFAANLANYPGSDVCNGIYQALIGLFREDIAGRWQWTDGTVYDYQNWAIGNPPNVTNLNFGYMHVTSICNEPTGRFGATYINVVLAKFVCKKQPF